MISLLLEKILDDGIVESITIKTIQFIRDRLNSSVCLFFHSPFENYFQLKKNQFRLSILCTTRVHCSKPK